jgi:hypothetical protein
MPLKRGEPGAQIDPVAKRFLLDESQPGSFRTLLYEEDLDQPRSARNRLRPIWDLHREALLKLYIRRHAGQRPRAWWAFDAPEPRRLVFGTLAPLPAFGFDCGIPRSAANWSANAAHEAQATYLDRAGLLTPGERRRLHAEDFQPELWRHWSTDPIYDSVLRVGPPADVLAFRAPEPPPDEMADDGLEP